MSDVLNAMCRRGMPGYEEQHKSLCQELCADWELCIPTGTSVSEAWSCISRTDRAELVRCAAYSLYGMYGPVAAGYFE
jgi:hypothetical protein